jgi:hypothetical protein
MVNGEVTSHSAKAQGTVRDWPCRTGVKDASPLAGAMVGIYPSASAKAQQRPIRSRIFFIYTIKEYSVMKTGTM